MKSEQANISCGSLTEVEPLNVTKIRAVFSSQSPSTANHKTNNVEHCQVHNYTYIVFLCFRSKFFFKNFNQCTTHPASFTVSFEREIIGMNMPQALNRMRIKMVVIVQIYLS